MKERGLLCTASVALALHEGRQTQDRRPINFKTVRNREQSRECFGPDGYDVVIGRNITRLPWTEKEIDRLLICPVQVGDIFYVKETWTGTWCYESMHIVYAADGTERTMEIPEVPADYALPKVCLKPGNWASPFFMPPWASRTRKLVTGIRVEHGPEISEEDARAEGVVPVLECGCDENYHDDSYPRSYGCAFKKLWLSLYGDDKPWRWVYELGEV